MPAPINSTISPHYSHVTQTGISPEHAGALCHLSGHIDGPLQPVLGNATLLRTGRAKHHAVLLLDSMVGWYRALAAECKALPEVKGVSWHVDVVVKPAGWLGTYRKSAVTGLWFAGRHHVHVQGT